MDIFSKNKLLFWIIIVFLLINTTAIIFLLASKPGRDDYPGMRPDKRKGPPRNESMLLREVIEFDKEQRKQFDAIEEKYFEEDRNLNDQIRKIRKETGKIIISDTVSTERLGKLTDESVQVYRKIRENDQWRFIEIKKLCNEKQKEKFELIMNEIINMPPPGPHMHEDFRKEGK